MTLDRLDTVIAFAVVMLGVSLLITIATQMISSFLGLRGTNLLWGIKTILKDAGIKTGAGAIARRVLTNSKISDSVFSVLGEKGVLGFATGRVRLATAIRFDELSRILREIVNEKAPQAASPSGAPAPAAAAAAARGRVWKWWSWLWRGDTEDASSIDDPGIPKAITDALKAADEVARAKLEKLREVFGTANTTWTVAADRVVQQVSDSARQSVLKLETSFATVMDRAAQRFAMKMRLWTVVLALVVAFGVHLDSLQLLQQLATNPDQRGALVSISNTMVQEAELVIPAPGPSTPAGDSNVAAPAYPTIAPAVLKEAMDNLKNTKEGEGLDSDGKFTSYKAATDWFVSQKKENLEPAYQREVISALKRHAEAINNQLIQGGFRLIPSPYNFQPWFRGWRNLLGILITVVFLSLGAPFWFNALKSMSNLRTVLADNEKKDTGKA